MREKPKFSEIAPTREKGVLAEFFGLLQHNKKYWMIPIIAVLLVFGALIVFGGTSAAPFIYTLF